MNRVVALAACGLALAGCSSMPSWMPSMELPRSSGPVTTVQLESEPAGAEAKTSTGPSCRTPCSLSVTGNEFTVTYTLPGYQPQTVPVRIVTPNEPTDAEAGQYPAARVLPNPVYAELQPAPPPPPARRRAAPPPKRPVAAAPARPAPAAAMAPAPAPAPASPWPPPPQPR